MAWCKRCEGWVESQSATSVLCEDCMGSVLNDDNEVMQQLTELKAVYGFLWEKMAHDQACWRQIANRADVTEGIKTFAEGRVKAIDMILDSSAWSAEGDG